jgi:hypothetical protein
MKDATATMGAILPDDVGGRDAVHVAVVAATAAHELKPGQDVAADGTITNPIGIVDPYLKREVMPGQRFWLFLYPRTITSLKHQWTHPAFADDDASATYSPPAQKVESERWLKNFAERQYHDYDQLIKAATLDEGASVSFEDDYDYCGARKEVEYLHFSGVSAHGEIPAEFWTHVEIVTGKKIGCKPSYFSCSC